MANDQQQVGTFNGGVATSVPDTGRWRVRIWSDLNDRDFGRPPEVEFRTCLIPTVPDLEQLVESLQDGEFDILPHDMILAQMGWWR